MPKEKPVIVSGVQSSGNLHIGNLFGAIQNWVGRQDEYTCYIFVADLHALTVPDLVRPDDLRNARIEGAAAYLACGIDPQRSVIFRQSDVSEHAYAGWLMTCATPIGWLERMTQFKAKAQRGERESVSAGLLTYPALQAADIVLYDANYVPTGEDQKQHIEYTRNLVERFNTLYEPCLTVPYPLIETTGARIMGLDDPEVKMSKSLAQDQGGHAVMLTDDDATIKRKIRRAVTDSGSQVDPATAGAGVTNLVEIYAGAKQIDRQAAFDELGGLRYGELKEAVYTVLVERLAPIRDKYFELMADPSVVRDVLADGADRAGRVAHETLTRMRHVVGVS